MPTENFETIFLNYFENTDEPSLKDFVARHESLVVANYKLQQNIEGTWVTRYGREHKKFYKDRPVEDRPKVVVGNVDWLKVVKSILENMTAAVTNSGSNSSTPCPTSSTARSQSTTTSNVTITEAFIKEFRQAHEAMDSNLKWKLSTGTVVEDVLFDYGLNCNYEDVAHSFIIDMTCKELMEKFTEKEIEEIGERSKHPLPDIPEKLMECVNGYVGLDTIESIETRVRKRLHAFDTEFYLDWAQHSIQNVIRLFRSNYYPLNDQTEADIIRRVYGFIDTAFDDLQLDVRTWDIGEYRKLRQMKLTAPAKRLKKHGYRTDILFKCSKGEVGCCEVGKTDAGDIGTKEKNELGLKVPKMLKDMMWKLAHVCPKRKTELVVIGFVMMGLNLRALVLDNPSTYVCRLNKTNSFYFPTTPETTASDFGALLGIVSQIKQLLVNTVNAPVHIFGRNLRSSYKRANDLTSNVTEKNN